MLEERKVFFDGFVVETNGAGKFVDADLGANLKGKGLEEFFELGGFVDAVEAQNVFIEIVMSKLIEALFGVLRMGNNFGITAVEEAFFETATFFD